MKRLRDGRRAVVESLEDRRLLAFNPTADEQHFLQLMNRFRDDPAGEYGRLISRASPITARDPVLQDDLDFAGVNGTTLRNELRTLDPTHPLTWNEIISDFTEDHNQAIINRGTHFHSNTAARRQTLMDNGVDFRFRQGEKINSEIVYGYGKSVNHLYASYVIDWQRGGPGGMVSGRGHRVAIHNPDFEQVGTDIRNYTGSGSLPLGPKVNSAILANIENPPVYVTGAIFEDKNDSGWYEAGEGLRNVRFVFTDQDGTEFTATSLTAGGYQIELPPSTYSATATGGGMRYAQRMSNIVVGETGVWKNWIYDPDVIPPDSLESNNSRGAATRLTGETQTLSALNIHSTSDSDYFRLVSNGTGELSVSLQFTHGNGNLDLQLQNASGSVIASATSSSNNESLSADLEVGKTYYVRVFGAGGARNGSYNLTVRPPQALPPIAVADLAIFTSLTDTIEVDVLQNDSDPDGSHASLTPVLDGTAGGAFWVTSGKRVGYEPAAGYSGIQRMNYHVTNGRGDRSQDATLAVFVLNFDDETPWQNTDVADVNDDGAYTAVDALLTINAINRLTNPKLPESAGDVNGLYGFVDASGDGFATALDALIVINQVNEGSGGGEGELALDESSKEQALDLALAGVPDFLDEMDEKRRRSRQ
ncbi:MAG: Ig-like domain-containing protein [Pirellulaceae bacterium]